MRRILCITTVFRVGEKVYPVIPLLAQHAKVDVLNLYQMSQNSPWIGTSDPRQAFYKTCEQSCKRILHGPAACFGGDNLSRVYTPFAENLDHFIDRKYDLVFIDNNIPTKGGATSDIYKWFNKRGIPVIAAPHANRDFRGYKVIKHMGGSFDYSFILGEKDRSHLLKVEKKYANKDRKRRLIPAGIPSNDKIKDYPRGNKYILVITNLTDPKHIRGPVKHLKPFTKKEAESLQLGKLAKEFNCPVVIKLKNKMFYQTSSLENALTGIEGLQFMTDCDDDNELIANAKFIISHPSTMVFKPIQIGIPTYLLPRYGMVGNFYDFPALIECNYDSLKTAMQDNNVEKYPEFIKRTLTGGNDFSSSQIYLDAILNKKLTPIKRS